MDVEVAQAHIRPASDQLTVAQISIAGPKQIDVRAKRGSLQFSYKGKTQLVPEGAVYRFILDPSDEDRSVAASTSAFPNARVTGVGGKENKAFLYFIIGGIGVVTWIAIDEALESPDKP